MSHTVNCPICDGEVALPADTIQGEIIDCPECGSELEVTSTKPYEVQEAPEEEEDWGE